LVTLHDGDVIYVPAAPLCYVAGEVRKPEGYRVEKNMTVERAIALAGGPTAIGNMGKIDIERHLPSGEDVLLHGKLSDAVQPDDIITVKERIF
jgi:polysaccharide export outer membrane protein